MKLSALLACSLLACSSSVSPADGGNGEGAGGLSASGGGGHGGDGGALGGGGAGAASGGGGYVITGTLGMNDVSILAPLPTNPSDVVLARASDLASDGQPFVPIARYDQALAVPGHPSALLDLYDDLQIVAVRLDLCDRTAPGLCPESDDGRLRVVFQPVVDGSAFDLGFHAFYSIPRANLSDAVTQFRELASLRNTALTDPLTVNQDVASNDAYRAKLLSIVDAYGGGSRLVRLTAMGQVATAAAFRWVFHGIELKNGQFVDIQVAGSGGATSSEVLLLANASYQLTPEVDSPGGFLLGVSEGPFNDASSPEQNVALQALVAADNPLSHSASTVQCAACHLATAALPRRATAAAIDPLTLPGRYQSGFDLAVSGGASATDDAIIRGFGYRNTAVAISQRVVNETAQVLEEIELQFPAP